MELTEAGLRLLPVLTDAFGRILDESRRIAAGTDDLRIICPPATSIRWLIPRLDGFRRRHPEIRVRLTTDFHGDFGFDPHAHDLGFSVSNWPNRARDLEVQPFLPVLLTPACAPALLSGDPPLADPADLAHHTLLHETPRHTDWRTWLEAFPVQGVDPDTGDEFTNLDMATKAAVMGTGVVMADRALNRDELLAGTLVRPFPGMVAPSPFGDICLIGARERWNDPKVAAFRDWVAETARDEPDSGALRSA